VRPGGQAQYSHMLSHQAVTAQPKRRSEAILADRVQFEFAQKRILCVDDNVLELTLRGKILELQGYSVVLLSCPRQVLRCDLSAFDLAVLDFDMPGLNGRDLFLRMRALHARFPILLLSAFASTLCREDCVLFSKCLNKGEPVGYLLDVIAAFLDPNEIPDFGR
jgi:CheY-like chemotaxis protein